MPSWRKPYLWNDRIMKVGRISQHEKEASYYKLNFSFLPQVLTQRYVYTTAKSHIGFGNFNLTYNNPYKFKLRTPLCFDSLILLNYV